MTTNPHANTIDALCWPFSNLLQGQRRHQSWRTAEHRRGHSFPILHILPWASRWKEEEEHFSYPDRVQDAALLHRTRTPRQTDAGQGPPSPRGASPAEGAQLAPCSPLPFPPAHDVTATSPAFQLRAVAPGPTVRRFSLLEILDATDNFDEGSLLGVGGFSKVYWGVLNVGRDGVYRSPSRRGILGSPESSRDQIALSGEFRGQGSWGTSEIEQFEKEESSGHMDVAVKRMDGSAFSALDQWMAEIQMLQELEHPNLVRLLGWAYEDARSGSWDSGASGQVQEHVAKMSENNRQESPSKPSPGFGEALLVYELYEAGPLSAVLFNPQASLGWEERVRIALDVAKGLEYLHSKNVIHRDLKPSNILLDKNLRGHLADFGLARSGPAEHDTHVSSLVKGTRAYLDPEYFNTGRLTKRTDVYSFGVVLLELLTGIPAQNKLLEWALPLMSRQPRPAVKDLVDLSLQGEYSKSGAMKISILARHCVDPDPLIRPDVQLLVSSLERLQRDK